VLDINDVDLKEKELLSHTFKVFNNTIEKLSSYQNTLETQVRELNSELSMKNQELTNVLESLSNGLIVTDLHGKIITFNRCASAITDVPKDMAIGKNINVLFKSNVLPKPLDVSGLTQVSENFRRQFTYVKSTGEKVIFESTTTLMKSDQDELLGLIVNLNDITMLKRLEEEAERKNRLTAMGEIAANMAHEIRNPLGSIEIFVSLLKMDLADDPEQEELLNHISSATRSMNHLISNLLEYTKPRPIVMVEMDIHQIVGDLVDFSRHIATQREIEIDTQFIANNHIVRGDLELFKQIFHNLFVNATQAMVDGGKVTIVIDNIMESDPKQLKRYQRPMNESQEPIELLRLSLTDTGAGMPEDVKRKIFDPFFTTKERGTGLGMSIVSNIIDSHNGAIMIDSELDVGTTVTIQLPAVQEYQEIDFLEEDV
jgi:PAS domain S-box-containing protein